MNLLVEGIKNNTVIKTNKSDDLIVDDVSFHYDIYKIRLDNLYYNDQNDRIATRISQYKQENGIDAISKENIEEYNDIIHSFIKESNSSRFKDTLTNIRLFGQKRYGVVLSDGRIIDGNRRFTCLRELAKTDSKFNYFEAVILKHNVKDNAKAIKTLELQLQIGEDKPVEYDPIDRLVGLYRDVIENNLLTVKEYHRATQIPERNIKDDLEIAKLMVEFLESINADKQYYLARDLKLDGPLRELNAALKKIKDPDKREEVKFIGFSNLVVQPDSSPTLFIRNIKDIAASPYLESFIEQETEKTEQVLDSLGEIDKVTPEVISQIRADDDLKQEFKDIMEVTAEKANLKNSKKQPVSAIRKAIKNINEVDLSVLSRLNEDELEEIRTFVEQLKIDLKPIEELL